MTPEPTPATMEEVGRLCAAWAAVELRTEETLWGLLRLDKALAEAFIWRMGINQRWQLITREVKKRLSEDDWKEAKRIRNLVETVSSDRNIVVHGIIHTVVLPDRTMAPPCWTIYMGEQAGKNFPVSEQAVRVIRENMNELDRIIREFNLRHNFRGHSLTYQAIEPDWPKPL